MPKLYQSNLKGVNQPRKESNLVIVKTRPLDTSRELLKQVLGDSEWTGFKDASTASKMLQSVLGVSWKPQTLHRYRIQYDWPRGVMWLQAPGTRGTVTYSVLEITAWYLRQQENS